MSPICMYEISKTSFSFLFSLTASIIHFFDDVSSSRFEKQLRFDDRHPFTRSHRSSNNVAPPTKVKMSLTFIEPFDERARQPNIPFTRSNITSNTWLSNRARRAVQPCKPRLRLHKITNEVSIYGRLTNESVRM